MKSILLATGALLIASAAPALAQDAAAPADTGASTSAMSSDAPTFAGPRAEIFGGWDRTSARTRFDDGTTRDTAHGHKNGGVGGVLLGYDMPIGDKLTAGLFGSYSLSTNKVCGTVGVDSGCIKAGREIEGGARVGYKVMPKALVYVKGAYVNGQVRGTFSDGVNYVSDHSNRDGWRAGAGVEYALTKNAYVKAEYDYTRFKSFDANDLGVTDTSLRFQQSQVLGGFGIHF